MNQIEKTIQVIEEKAEKYSVNGLHTDRIIQDITGFKVKIVLVGAFSAGKSALLNTFLSRDILQENQGPETAIASEIFYDNQEYVEAVTASGVQSCTLVEKDKFDRANVQYLKWHLNAPTLREITEYILVDMPGFNSGIQAHNKAILQYVDQANAYLLVIDAEDGGIKQSVSTFINEIRNYENNMAIVITKSDLKTEEDLVLVKEAVADVAGELFDYEVPIIVTSKFDENAQTKLRNLILAFDRESIFRQTFLPQVAEAGERIIQVLMVLKKNASLNTSDLEEEIHSRERAKMKLAEKLQKERIRLSDKLRNKVQPSILADAEKALRQQADALASSLASGGSNFSMLVNNILRPVLVSSTQAYVENSFDEFVSSMPLDISGQGTDLNEIFTRYQKVNENLMKNLPETVDKFNGVYKAITVALAVTTTVVAPWLELVLIFLPDVIKLISPMFQQRQQDKILTEVNNRIIPGIIQKLGPEINSSLGELEEEMMKQLEEKMKDMIDLETSALENAKTRIMELQEDYTQKIESIDRDIADIRAALNAMSSFGSQANFPVQELEKIITQIHIRGKKVFVTFNSAAHSFDQLLWIDSYIEQLKALSIDGIILGSLEVLCHLRGCGLPLSMSTMGGTYNSDIVSFYRDLGVRRIILPRDITLRDMEKIVSQFPEIHFEAFLMRNGCKYSDANCMSYHSRKYGSMCATLDEDQYAIEINRNMKAQDVREIRANHTLFTKAFHKRACGLCAIDDLLNMGISSVKIVGRADCFDSVIADIKQVRALIDEPGHSGMSINKNCLYQLNCYYNYNYS